jgi:ankyrin repeat protein
VITVTLLVAYPVAVLVASPVVRAWKARQVERELARVGDFPEPASRALAESIQSGDIERLQSLLAGGPVPAVRDRAGNDLLAFAAVVVRDRQGDPETVRILLEAGADPRGSRTPDGGGLVHFMVLYRTPQSMEVVRLLLEHGADPNAKDPLTGTTPIADAVAEPELVRLLVEAGADVDQTMPGGESVLVRFIAMQHWNSALYLIERGAQLEVTNPDGLSVDYYLREFKDSVYGEHPEGWDRVRAAIEARRR